MNKIKNYHFFKLLVSHILYKNIKTVMFDIFISPFIYALLLVVSLTTYTIGLYCLNKGSVTSLDTVISLMSNNTSVIPVFIYLALLYAYIEFTLYTSKSSSFVVALCNYLIYQICNVILFVLLIVMLCVYIICSINTDSLGMNLRLVLHVVQYRDIVHLSWIIHGYKVRYFTGIFGFIFLSLGTIFYILQPVVLVDLWNTFLELKTTTNTPLGAYILPNSVSTVAPTPLYQSPIGMSSAAEFRSMTIDMQANTANMQAYCNLANIFINTAHNEGLISRSDFNTLHQDINSLHIRSESSVRIYIRGDTTDFSSFYRQESLKARIRMDEATEKQELFFKFFLKQPYNLSRQTSNFNASRALEMGNILDRNSPIQDAVKRKLSNIRWD